MRGGRILGMSASVAIAVLALVLTCAPGAIAAERERYIVVFEDSVEHPASLAGAQVEQRNGKLGFVYRYALNGYSAELPTQAVAGLRRDPRVKYVAADGEARPAAQTTPTGISRTFATANKALDIDGVDDVRIAANIAVIDTGVDYTHPDLNVVARTDCSNGTEKEAKCVDSSGTDTIGHGTHVAGIAGAIDNGSGVVGTAPGVQIWAVKVLGTGTNYTSEIIAGIEWVTAKRKDEDPNNNIDVINMSLECPGCEAKPYDEAITKAVEAGVVVVVAAGNKETDAKNTAPANSPNAITVSALADSDGLPGGKGPSSCTDDFPGAHVTRSLTDDTKASFSNYGATVDIAAPGVCILSTYPGNQYKKTSGTSMAAPHVAGAAAMLAARDRPESKADVEAIRNTLLEAGNSGWTDTSPDGIKEPLLDIGALPALFNLRNSNSAGPGDYTFQFGLSTDTPVSGDFNGDGKDTIGVYRPSTLMFYLRNTNSAGAPDISFSYGLKAAIPVFGDWDGDGDETVGLYDQTTGYWYLNQANDGSGAELEFPFGAYTGSDVPVPGDWDGDGDTTIGVYRPSTKSFYLRNSNTPGEAELSFSYGIKVGVPVAADWNGDAGSPGGGETIGLWNPETGWWSPNEQNDGSGADAEFIFGAKGDTPLTGDWNGDKVGTVGFFRP